MMPHLPPDPYKILGVDKKAQFPEIRTAYRKKVLTCHPDKVGPSEDPQLKEQKLAEFQQVQQAYELLSNETERTKYDDQVQILEMRKEMMAKNMANTSAPRVPSTYHMKVNIRTAEPRVSSFGPGGPGPMPMPRVVPVFADGTPSPKDDYLFVDTEGLRRSERRSAARKDSRDDDRDRERQEKVRRRRERDEREFERGRERERERERERGEEEERERERERQEARRERKRREERERKHEDKKHRHKSPAYVEDYEIEEVVFTTKKKSSSRKHEDKHREKHREKSTERVVKMHEKIDYATEYLRRRGQTLDRGTSFDSATYGGSPPAAPTPPPAPTMDSPFRKPAAFSTVDDETDEDLPRRSRATPRRDSYGMSHSTERLGHKKSYSGGPREEPMIFSASPTNRATPVFTHSASTPPLAPESPPRVGMHRAQTFQVPERPGPVPLQAFRRAETFNVGESSGRQRSRLVSQIDAVSEEEDELDDRRRHRKEKSHRSRRTHSPDPADYVRPHKGKMEREGSYRESSERTKTYYTVPPRGGVRVVPADPFYARSGSASYVASKVRTGKSYDEDDVKYAHYTDQRPYATAVPVGDGLY